MRWPAGKWRAWRSAASRFARCDGSWSGTRQLNTRWMSFIGTRVTGATGGCRATCRSRTASHPSLPWPMVATASQATQPTCGGGWMLPMASRFAAKPELPDWVTNLYHNRSLPIMVIRKEFKWQCFTGQSHSKQDPGEVAVVPASQHSLIRVRAKRTSRSTSPCATPHEPDLGCRERPAPHSGRIVPGR